MTVQKKTKEEIDKLIDDLMGQTLAIMKLVARSGLPDEAASDVIHAQLTFFANGFGTLVFALCNSIVEQRYPDIKDEKKYLEIGLAFKAFAVNCSESAVAEHDVTNNLVEMVVEACRAKGIQVNVKTSG